MTKECRKIVETKARTYQRATVPAMQADTAPIKTIHTTYPTKYLNSARIAKESATKTMKELIYATSKSYVAYPEILGINIETPSNRNGNLRKPPGKEDIVSDWSNWKHGFTCGEEVFESGFREERIDDSVAFVWDASVEKFPAGIESKV